jgi:hypothetical protein
VGWLALFLACLLLYGLTANRGAQWQDSGFHILRIATGEVLNPRGLALCHPLHHWLGRLAILPGVGEPSAVVTLISALAAALAVANVYGCVVTLTDRPGCALFAAASLAVAHTFWQLATVAETYTLTAALLAAECWCLVGFIRYGRTPWLFLLALCNGLGIANHMVASLTTPVLVVVTLVVIRQRRITWKHGAVAVGLWLMGTAPYAGLVLQEIMCTGQWTATLHSALFGAGHGQSVLNLTVSARMLLSDIGFPLLNFPNLLIPTAFIGIFRARSIGVSAIVRRALLAALLIHAAFVLRYNVVDQHTFFLPVYVLLAIFGGMGAAVASDNVSDITRRRLQTLAVILLITTPICYLILPAAARQIGLLENVKHNKPYRDDYTYLLAPWSVTDRSAEQMSTHAMKLAGRQGLVFYEDGMAEFALAYKALRTGMNRDQVCAARRLKELTASAAIAQTVVLVPENTDSPRTPPPTGQWSRQGDLYILDTAATAPCPQ